MNKQLIARGHEFAGLAETATSNGMALVYLKKAYNYYSDGGRDDLAKLIEGMIESL